MEILGTCDSDEIREILFDEYKESYIDYVRKNIPKDIFDEIIYGICNNRSEIIIYYKNLINELNFRWGYVYEDGEKVGRQTILNEFIEQLKKGKIPLSNHDTHKLLFDLGFFDKCKVNMMYHLVSNSELFCREIAVDFLNRKYICSSDLIFKTHKLTKNQRDLFWISACRDPILEVLNKTNEHFINIIVDKIVEHQFRSFLNQQIETLLLNPLLFGGV